MTSTSSLFPFATDDLSAFRRGITEFEAPMMRILKTGGVGAALLGGVGVGAGLLLAPDLQSAGLVAMSTAWAGYVSGLLGAVVAPRQAATVVRGARKAVEKAFIAMANVAGAGTERLSDVIDRSATRVFSGTSDGATLYFVRKAGVDGFVLSSHAEVEKMVQLARETGADICFIDVTDRRVRVAHTRGGVLHSPSRPGGGTFPSEVVMESSTRLGDQGTIGETCEGLETAFRDDPDAALAFLGLRIAECRYHAMGCPQGFQPTREKASIVDAWDGGRDVTLRDGRVLHYAAADGGGSRLVAPDDAPLAAPAL